MSDLVWRIKLMDGATIVIIAHHNFFSMFMLNMYWKNEKDYVVRWECLLVRHGRESVFHCNCNEQKLKQK